MTTEAPRLPSLSTSDTQWLVNEATKVLIDLGHTPHVVEGVALGMDDGRTVGLDDLARTTSSRTSPSSRRADPRVTTSWVEFLDGPDAYGAARVTVLPELLRRMRIPFASHGVLVAVPTTFELWVHVPVDDAVVDTAVVDTAVAMSWLALRTFAEEPYPISPDVYLVSPDTKAVRVVRPDERGCDVDERAMSGLLQAMRADLPDAG
ncbi:hypothetical protein F4692_002337 [Nocardioides cavernae]|uniref:Uncharacterized protein n=1 Tax=Nocardioides cavernae TaxID=1921566 RepID=A0A7Y9H3B5_9ACTN|nr:hypothetical protein [Nocardioides cavernae]NYE37204.1 hypothetical protein [Nocardioides cavernae]